ncbi:MAG: hypothetical protein HFJ45_07570 [Clostridia bacterium]|nr:hypothetical protein [Clostridia bacterium]
MDKADVFRELEESEKYLEKNGLRSLIDEIFERPEVTKAIYKIHKDFLTNVYILPQSNGEDMVRYVEKWLSVNDLEKPEGAFERSVVANFKYVFAYRLEVASSLLMDEDAKAIFMEMVAGSIRDQGWAVKEVEQTAYFLANLLVGMLSEDLHSQVVVPIEWEESAEASRTGNIFDTNGKGKYYTS